jgi:hypothetical protein
MWLGPAPREQRRHLRLRARRDPPQTLWHRPQLDTILQVLSAYPFEKVPLFQLFTATPDLIADHASRNQLTLFDL